MADATKTAKPAEVDEDQARVAAAVEPPAPAPEKLTARDKAIAKARDRELERQAAVVDAVAKANTDELPALGGVWLDPGLGT